MVKGIHAGYFLLIKLHGVLSIHYPSNSFYDERAVSRAILMIITSLLNHFTWKIFYNSNGFLIKNDDLAKVDAVF